MCKFIRWLILFIIIGVVAFMLIAILEGGDPFRWLGKKLEETGRLLQEKSDELAEDADKLKDAREKLKEQSEKVENTTKELLKK